MKEYSDNNLVFPSAIKRLEPDLDNFKFPLIIAINRLPHFFIITVIIIVADRCLQLQRVD